MCQLPWQTNIYAANALLKNNYVACLCEGACVNTLWTFPAAHREMGVTPEAENHNPLVRPANCCRREKGPESLMSDLAFC